MSNIFYRIHRNHLLPPKDSQLKPFIAAIGSDNWATLCVLAMYMDKEGICYPSYATIAHALGVKPQTACERVHKLAEAEYDQKPIIEIMQARGKGGRFAPNVYRIVTETISIF